MAEWSSIEISTDPLMEKVQPIVDSMVAVLDYLLAILNIVQKVLNIVKAFLVGLLDPIRAVVELIIQEIRNLIADLRQLGVYFAGDWALLNPANKFSDVLGGYQAYERRMLSRLLDPTDLSRPDFSSSSVALGVFFYASSGDINELMRILRTILKFFGRDALLGNSMPYGTPTTPEFKFGAAGGFIPSFKKTGELTTTTDVPDAMTVTWSMPAGAGGIGGAFTPAPKGFLIHISTIPDGLQVLAMVPKSDGSAKTEDLPRVVSAAIDPLTNGPLRLYGGIADLDTGQEDFADVEYTDDPQAPILLLQKDTNTPLIKPSTLIDGSSSVPLIACTYFVKTGFISKLGPGTTFTAVFDQADLPKHVSFEADTDGFAKTVGEAATASTYWVRVRAVTQDYLDVMLPSIAGSSTLRSPTSTYGNGYSPYYFPAENLVTGVNGILVPPQPSAESTSAGWNSMTPASGAGVVEFPSEASKSFVAATQTAIALAVLCRADLTEGNLGNIVGIGIDLGSYKQGVYAYGQGLKGLEGAGRDIMNRYGIKPVWFKGLRPQRFRLKMRLMLNQVASDIAEKGTPPDSVVEALQTHIDTLADFLWNDIHDDYPGVTILESLGLTNLLTATVAQSEDLGVGGNPFCRPKPKSSLVQDYRQTATRGPTRAPGFDLNPVISTVDPWEIGDGSADYSPIIYNNNTGTVEYIRNAVSGYNEGALLDAAVAVMQLASAWVSRPINDAQWQVIRLMPQALAPLDDLMERIDRFLQGLLAGLEGIVDKIVAYIEAIQARIYQLQALLNQIKAIISAITAFRIGPVSALVLVGNGTSGLVSGLVASENKPVDTASSYGAGVVAVTGGLPTVLFDLIKLVLSGEEA